MYDEDSAPLTINVTLKICHQAACQRTVAVAPERTHIFEQSFPLERLKKRDYRRLERR